MYGMYGMYGMYDGAQATDENYGGYFEGNMLDRWKVSSGCYCLVPACSIMP